MSNRLIKAGLAVAGGGLVVLAALILGAHVFQPREPVYDHRPVSFWLCNLTGPNLIAAKQAFRVMGSEAVPWLLQRIQHAQSSQQKLYSALWESLPRALAARLPLPSPVVSALFPMALSALGPPALASLCEAFGDDQNIIAQLELHRAVRRIAGQSEWARCQC